MLIENIFNQLINNSRYFQVVYPFLKKDYFSEKTDVELFKVIKYFFETYNKVPKFSDLKILIEANEKISIEDTEALYKKIDEIKSIQSDITEELLIKETEKFCQDRAMELAILESVDILQKGQSRGLIEEKIKQALGIQFIVDVGHDYFRDAKKRLEGYFKSDERIATDIEEINNALGGGLIRKTMTLLMSSTNIGKTTNLCHYASAFVKQGIDVLYITGEESEEEILKKNDANLLDISIDNLNLSLDRKLFTSKLKKLYESKHGNLIVKEFPTGTANSNHIRTLLTELKLKRNFVPVVVILDGLNNFASSKLPSSQTGTSIYVKSVAEEQRALGMEFNYALLSNAQFNRSAKSKKENADLEDVGEAYAISQTADFACSLIQTDELREQNKYLMKVLKTRISKTKGHVFTVGIDYDKMRLFNLKDDQKEIPIHIKDQLKAQQHLKDEKEISSALFDFD